MLKGKFLIGAALTAAILWAATSLLLLAGGFNRAEFLLYDSIYQRVHPVDTRIVVIGIDEESIARLGQWPWPRGVMGEMIDILSEGGAAAIGIDVEYDTPSRYPIEDEQLAEALRNYGNVVLPVRGLFRRRTGATMGGYIQADSLVVPHLPFRENVYLGHVNGYPEADGVIRKGLYGLSYGGEIHPSLSVALYEAASERLNLPDIANVPLDSAGRYYISFTGRSGWYYPISFADVYEGLVPPAYFNDKIVLIGLYAEGVARDWHFTAIDGGFATYGVEIHANMVQQLLDGRFIRDLNIYADLSMFALMTLLSAVLFILSKPRRGLMFMALLLIIYLGVFFFLWNANLVFHMIYTPVYIVAAYFAILIWHHAQTRFNEMRVRNTFGRYMAPTIIKKILDENEDSLKLGGQRRYVTVLYIDIRGFTPLSEEAPPEEVVSILNEYLDIAATSIHKHGGTLDKFIGDAVMAIWNAPYETPGHQLAAAYAAIEIQSEAAKIDERLFKQYGRSMSFGMGINTGDAVIGNIGASFRMDYTAIGDTVNVSARLQAMAGPRQILISKATADNLANTNVETKLLGPHEIKGRKDTVDVYEIILS